MKRNISGQEIIEVMIISTVIFLASIVTMMLLGNQIGALFDNQNKLINSTTVAPDYDKDDLGVANGGMGENLSIAGYPVKQHADGSLTYTVEGQEVNIPKTYVDQMNTVLQTTGSSGVEEILAEIAKMIIDNQAAYPGVPVPVKVSFGSSMLQDGGSKYGGDAQATTTTLTVGNSVVIIQRDKVPPPPPPAPVYENSDKKRKIVGTHDGSGNFTGEIYSFDNINKTYISPSTAKGSITFNSGYVSTLNHNGAPADFGGYQQADFDFSTAQFTP